MIIKRYEKYFPYALSFIAAFCIFLLMQYLITTDVFNKKKDEDISFLEFIRINTDDSLLERDRKIPDRPKPEKRPPPPPDIDLKQDTKLIRPNLDIELPNFSVPVDFSGAFLGNMNDLQGTSTALIPMVRVAPQCPVQAIQGGIDGKVQVYLVVGPNGRVKTARIVRATNGTLFNKETTKAIRRWQFKPKVINGIPVEQAGEVTVEFFCNA
ncbi:MAG: energy transducer TonB [Gammaproteobacteria bacterium]|jgi:protein TonB|nr:energy transducer TonB [Gammaproteobacteria bacterium]|tara:strand:+ start:763 stop:1395 length:633 start_codon:yes stop_codon:yes gene_type:complete